MNYFVDPIFLSVGVFFRIRYNLQIAENIPLLKNTSTFSRFRQRWTRRCVTVAVSSNTGKKKPEAFKNEGCEVCLIYFKS